MKPLVALAISFLLVTPAVPSLAQPSGDQGQLRKDLRAGNVRSLREIEQQILPTMAGTEYLGPEYDKVAMAYRLKFIRNGTVVFIDVDARSGAILNRSH